jgi:hypothetical protein
VSHKVKSQSRERGSKFTPMSSWCPRFLFVLIG